VYNHDWPDHSPPISSVPFDLLFVHLVLPPSFAQLAPEGRLTRAFRKWWRGAAAFFRLSPLMYGDSYLHGRERYPEQDRVDPWILERAWSVVDNAYQAAFGSYDNAETMARVPNVDRVALLPPHERRRGVFIPLDAQGAPKTAEDKLRLLKQDRAARHVDKDPKEEYTIVWLPSRWRIRIHAFIFAALCSASALIATALFVPLIVGRLVTGTVLGEVHDGYSWVRDPADRLTSVCRRLYLLGRFRRWAPRADLCGFVRQSSQAASHDRFNADKEDGSA
jgi:E3 ubiquitin-protein ligase MARCH6